MAKDYRYTFWTDPELIMQDLCSFSRKLWDKYQEMEALLNKQTEGEGDKDEDKAESEDED